jgi:hypothetical protein
VKFTLAPKISAVTHLASGANMGWGMQLKRHGGLRRLLKCPLNALGALTYSIWGRTRVKTATRLTVALT